MGLRLSGATFCHVKQLSTVIFICALVVAIFATKVKAESAPATEPGAAAAAVATAAGKAAVNKPPVSPDAPTLFSIGPLPVTNSMVYTWVVGAVIFFIVRAGTRRMQEVPSGTQNLVEATVEGLEDLSAGVLEPKVARWVFPFAATFFIFILISNVMGLLPGVGSIGWGHPSGTLFGIEHAETPLFRPPTADANMTVAMAGLFLVMGLYWAFRYNGVFGFIKHTFGVKGESNKWSYLPLAALFLFIGAVELFSILFVRPLALAMRLYGNILGGESVVTDMLLHTPLGLGALPFYFFELFVAVVQALVFALLVIAFVGTMCMHDDTEAAH